MFTRILILLFLITDVGAYYKKPKRIGVESLNIYPFFYIKDGEYQGATRDIIDLFSEKTKIRISYIPMPIKRLYQSLHTKDISFKFPDNENWTRNRKDVKGLVYSDPVFKISDSTFSLRKQKSKIVVIGVISGFSPVAYKGKKIKILNAKGVKELVNMLLKKRVQAIYYNKRSLELYIKENKLSKKITYRKDLPENYTEYKLSTIYDEDVIKEFNKFLEDESDKVEKILKKYKIKKGPK